MDRKVGNRVGFGRKILFYCEFFIYPIADGIAAISSMDGRHLALMPHPERCSIMWQWPYVPNEFAYEKSPWQTLFDEAQIWCANNNN